MEHFSEFYEYYVIQRQSETRLKSKREDLALLQDMILPYLDEVIMMLEEENLEVPFDVRLRTAFRAAVNYVDISEKFYSGIEAVSFEVAMLDNEERNLERALNNFRYHYQRLIEIKYELIKELNQ